MSSLTRFEDSELSRANDNPVVDDGDHVRTTTVPLWLRARANFTKRQMAHISPRLGLLNNLPMTVPFRTRLEVFRQFVA
jgi:ubiquitin-protein ligase E3 C